MGVGAEMTAMTPTPRRNRDLARIHILKADLRLDDESYRDMLFAVARVRSAADLDAGGRAAVLDHLQALAGKAQRRRDYPDRPHNIESEDRGPLLRKIEALLTDAGRPWRYVRGMAYRMFHGRQLEFCSAEELRKIVAALVIDARRRGGRGAG